MNGPEATALGEWVKIAFYVIGSLAGIAVSLNQLRRKPHIDVDLSTVSARLQNIEDVMRNKQDSKICVHLHDTLTGTLDEIKERHEKFEDKISRQIGGVHERITAVFGELRSIEGSLKGKS